MSGICDFNCDHCHSNKECDMAFDNKVYASRGTYEFSETTTSHDECVDAPIAFVPNIEGFPKIKYPLKK